jgi:hypothetical protein
MIRTTLATILVLGGAMLATPLEAQTPTPTELHYWDTTYIRFGLETHTGNVESTNFTGDADWNRTVGLLESRFDFDSSWWKAHGTKILEKQRAEWELRRLLRPHSRWFALLDSFAEHHETNGIKLRTAVGPGLGVHAVDTKKNRFTLESGAEWTHERHNNGFTDSYAAAFFDEALLSHLTDHVLLDHDTRIRWDLSDTKKWHLYSETDLDFRITRIVYFSTGIIINYSAVPVKDHHKTDVETRTVLKIRFGRHGTLEM